MSASTCLTALGRVSSLEIESVLSGLPSTAREAVRACHEQLQRKGVQVALAVQTEMAQLLASHCQGRAAKAPRKEPVHLMQLDPDAMSKLAGFLPLDAHASLATTCHELLRGASTTIWEEARKKRTTMLLETVEKWMLSDQGIMHGAERENGAYGVIERVNDEFARAGKWGADGVLQLIQYVAPTVNELVPHYGDGVNNAHREQLVLIVAPSCVRLFASLDYHGCCWLPHAAAALAANLAAVGPHSLQTDYSLVVHGANHPHAPTLEARQAEMTQILLLGCLSRAAAEHVQVLLGKLFPNTEHDDEYEKRWDEDSWLDGLEFTSSETASSHICAGFVLEAISRVAPFLNGMQASSAAKTLATHVQPNDWDFSTTKSCCFRVAVAGLSLLFASHPAIVYEYVPVVLASMKLDLHSMPERPDIPECGDSANFAAILTFIGKVQLIRLLDVVLWSLAVPLGEVSYAAARAIENLWTQLDLSDKARVVTFTHKLISGEYGTREDIDQQVADDCHRVLSTISELIGGGQTAWGSYWQESNGQCTWAPTHNCCRCYECRRLSKSDLRLSPDMHWVNPNHLLKLGELPSPYQPPP